MYKYKSIFVNGLQVLGDNCPYYANLYNFLLDSSNTNNDSELYTDGDYSGTSKINSKTFNLVVWTKKQSDIKAAMQFSYVISKGDFTLTAYVEGLGEVECTVKKESITTDEFGVMTVQLKANVPYIYSKDYKELILEKQIEGGWKYPTQPFTIRENWTYTETVIGNIGECINEGFATVYPEITIEGEGSDFKIINNTSKEQLNIDVSIQTGDILYIDCKPETRKITLNNSSIMKHKSGEYISLLNGSNELKVDFTGNCTVYIRWREAWI